jgi:3-hydroxyisobutyrate dehydrogenase-like beta-hydroxyacid dehydrogenase
MPVSPLRPKAEGEETGREPASLRRKEWLAKSGLSGSAIWAAQWRSMPRMLRRDFTPGGTIDILYKDQDLETSFAKRLGVPLLLANLTQQVYQMARAAGLIKEDGSAIIKMFEQIAGVKISKGD